MHDGRVRRALLALCLGSLSTCVSPATELVIVVGSDAPVEQLRALRVTVRHGAQSDGSTGTIPPEDSGQILDLPGSFAIVPRSGVSLEEPVTVIVEGTVNAAAPYVLRREVRLRFRRHARVDTRVFLSTGCNGPAMGCFGAPCTVQRLCEERGESCGDDARCVSIEPMLVDASVCPAGTRACGAGCINAGLCCTHADCAAGSGCSPVGRCVPGCPNSASACGPSCGACPGVTNGSGTCNSGVCGSTCNVGFVFTGSNCVPVGSCGNGALDAGETCDDSNVQSGDGCSATCALEAIIAESCAGAPTPLIVRRGPPVRFRTTTAGRTNDGSGSCNANGPDIVVFVRTVDPGVLRLTVTPTSAWDAIIRTNGPCPGSVCIDSASAGAAERATTNVAANETTAWLIDGFSTSNAGEFVAEFVLQ